MSLCQRTILLLQLREQPHILDGDRRLVCKRLQQSDLLPRKGLDPFPADCDCADGGAVMQQGRDEDGSGPEWKLEGLALSEPSGLGEVMDMNGSPPGDGAVPDEVGAERIGLTKLQSRRQAPVSGDHRYCIPLHKKDEGFVGLADLGCRAGNCLENDL